MCVTNNFNVQAKAKVCKYTTCEHDKKVTVEIRVPGREIVRTPTHVKKKKKNSAYEGMHNHPCQ